jgi:hypothetical protein
MLGRAMTEWAILVILVPAVIVPVVLLLGFAGCFSKPEFVGRPFITVAEATSTTSIRIEWSYDGDGIIEFEIEVSEVGGSVLPIIKVPPPATSREVTGLDEASTYSFRVRVIRNGEDTNFSPPVEASTFGQTFALIYVPGQANDVTVEGSTLILRIEPSRLSRSGSLVVLTLTGPSAGTTSLDRIYLSQPAAAGDPYDAAPDLTPVFDINNGDAVVIIGPGELRTLPSVAYSLDELRPLLVAMDITPAPLSPSTIRAQPVPAQDGVTFARSVIEAALPDRTTGYSPQGSFFVLSRIDVA